MSRDQLVGLLLMVVSIAVIAAYVWVVFFTEWAMLLMQVTVVAAVTGVMGILAWIGYTLATTPPPKPIEEIEKEIEEELKKLEAETGKEKGEGSGPEAEEGR